jgi:uncharacterized phosphosugar-binding protein
MGPSYRDDMWAARDANPSLSVAERASQTYGSFATAWQVKNDDRLLAVKKSPVNQFPVRWAVTSGSRSWTNSEPP